MPDLRDKDREEVRLSSLLLELYTHKLIVVTAALTACVSTCFDLCQIRSHRTTAWRSLSRSHKYVSTLSL